MWYDTTSDVVLFVVFSVGGVRASSWQRCLLSLFDLLLYSGFIIATASEVFLQLCGSFVEGIIS